MRRHDRRRDSFRRGFGFGGKERCRYRHDERQRRARREVEAILAMRRDGVIVRLRCSIVMMMTRGVVMNGLNGRYGLGDGRIGLRRKRAPIGDDRRDHVQRKREPCQYPCYARMTKIPRIEPGTLHGNNQSTGSQARCIPRPGADN